MKTPFGCAFVELHSVAQKPNNVNRREYFSLLGGAAF
jgi:hypothetical protein